MALLMLLLLGRSAALLAAGLVVLGLSRVGAQDSHTYHLGSAVPGRNMPPIPDCTVVGKIFAPLTPSLQTQPYSTRVGWDWCQAECKHSKVMDFYGSVYPCQHFAFYPDGKCFLGGYNAVLETDHACNDTNPCEHGFHVISGPPDCANKSGWVSAPAETALTTAAPTESLTVVSSVTLTTMLTTEAPTLPPTPEAPTAAPTTQATVTEAPQGPKKVGTGEKCNGSLPPLYAILCEDGLACNTNGMLGAWGVCGKKETKDVSVAVPVIVVGDSSPATIIATLPSTVTVTAPPTVTLTTLAPPGTSTVVVPPPPANSTITGYYYEPHTLHGTVKMNVSNWEACRRLCNINPSCKHFGYWPDGGCHQQGGNVTLVRANQSVISGPDDLSKVDLWPNLEAAGLDVPASPVPTVAMAKDTATAVTDSAGPEFKKAGDSGGGGGSLGWSLGLLALLAVGGGLYAAYSMGLFGDKELFEDEDEDEDEEEGLQPRGAD